LTHFEPNDHAAVYTKQYQAAPDLARLLSFGISLSDLINALQANNLNVGAGYIERNGEQFLVRVLGQLADEDAIRRAVVSSLTAAEADARRARNAATTVNLASDGHWAYDPMRIQRHLKDELIWLK
jgi:Cu/Ag efflux pump CusA